LLLLVGLAVTGVGCGSKSGGGPLPATIVHQVAGDPADHSGPCESWVSPGIAAAFCAVGIEAPAASGDTSAGQLTFTGTPRSGAEGGIAQAAGTLPNGKSIGIKVVKTTTGTLVAQGICDRTLVRASFANLRFDAGDAAHLEITKVDSTPVILVSRNDKRIAPTKEVLVDLTWMPANAPQGCGFRVA
jgi:hypothetical protein